MAFTRKMLRALGIEDDKIEQIMDAHTEVTEALKTERDTAKAAADELTKVKEELAQTKESLKAAEKSAKDAKSQFDTEKAEHDKLKSEITAKATKEKADAAILKWAKEQGFSESGAKKIVKYGGYSDRVKFDDDGKPTNLDEFKEDVNAEWGEYKGEAKTESYKSSAPVTGGTAPKKSLAAQYYAEYQDRTYGTKTAASVTDNGTTTNSNKEG